MGLLLVSSLFVLLLGVTVYRINRSANVVHRLTSPVSQLVPFIKRHDICVVMFYDAYTCVQTMKYMNKLHQFCSKHHISFMAVNVTEGADPLSGTCPVCPYLAELQVKFVPAVFVYRDQKVVDSLMNQPDRLPFDKIVHFIQSKLLQTGR
ncbi:hypothetical protein [Lihuaxuella thermophila]|uniref:Thioredoxin n=1 Tax=Lihuaxuella thermophila TaxID=1173111 RepID=A0A1H8G545_9BACL|nr:hypothetical protein [Lihuaxuella thermophila]SEN39211.1 hypothetical protein SAMN05444955_11084 [Lihuaxuella thermophila]